MSCNCVNQHSITHTVRRIPHAIEIICARPCACGTRARASTIIHATHLSRAAMMPVHKPSPADRRTSPLGAQLSWLRPIECVCVCVYAHARAAIASSSSSSRSARVCVCLASAEQRRNVQLTHSDSIIKTFRHINACVRACAPECVCVRVYLLSNRSIRAHTAHN